MDYGSGISVDFDVPGEMRDGTVLRANVYRPAGDGPWPTLLSRTPYDKNNWADMSVLDTVQAARQGFLVVLQDTRGRFSSRGDFEPLRHERADGFDAVEWAARLPGSNGRVGMYGESYCGNTQWMAASQAPPSLAAIAPALTWADPMDGLFARGGAVELGVSLPWTMQAGFGDLARRGLTETELAERLEAMIAEYDALPDRGYWELPVVESFVRRRYGLPELGGLRVLDDPGVADACRVTGDHERVTVPSFHTGGWYDIFTQGILDNFVAMAGQGREARLEMGPWTHWLSGFDDPIGERLFGLRASRFGVPTNSVGDSGDLQLAWLRHHLTGTEQELPEKPVRIFVMGRNEWREESGWPLSRERTERLFLRAEGGLSNEAPAAEEGTSEFVYDPADPVPTVGGQTVMAPAYQSGPMDQASVEDRGDVLVFTSAPLQHDLEATGRVKLVVYGESSAVSTDWVGRLCDVDPGGRSFNLCDGILRVGEGADSPGRHEIDLWSTSNVFLAGHRIRVHLTSSCFPRWDRNLGTGDQRAARFVTAHQRIHHAAERASYIELPVIP